MFRKRISGLFAAAVVASASIGIGVPATQAAIVSVSDVGASISAPASATQPFDVVGTITNTGSVSQDPGSTLTLSASGGSVTAAPAGCLLGAGTAVCTTGALAPGASQSWTVKVAPNAGATSVTSTASAQAANGEINIAPDNANNTARAVTAITYSLGLSITSDPSTIQYGGDTLLSVTVTNTGAPQTIQVDVDTPWNPNQTDLDAACSGSASKVTCTKSYGVAESAVFGIVAGGVTTGTSFTSTATATGGTRGTETASVVTGLSDDATALVLVNDSIFKGFSNVSASVLVTPGSTTGGLFVDKIGQVDASTLACGTKRCSQWAPQVLFRTDGKYRPLEDLSKTLRLTLTYKSDSGPLITCNGGGSGAQCYADSVYYQLEAGSPVNKMGKCAVAGTIPSLYEWCYDSITKTTKGINVVARGLRDIVIPIIGDASLGSTS